MVWVFKLPKSGTATAATDTAKVGKLAKAD